MAPGTLAFTYLGYAGREAAAGSEGIIRNALIALALLAVVMFLPRLVKRLSDAKHGLTTVDLKRRLDAGETLIVLDVRDVADYAGDRGHIPGAKNIPLAEVHSRLDELEAWRQHPLAVVARDQQNVWQGSGPVANRRVQ